MGKRKREKRMASKNLNCSEVIGENNVGNRKSASIVGSLERGKTVFQRRRVWFSGKREKRKERKRKRILKGVLPF